MDNTHRTLKLSHEEIEILEKGLEIASFTRGIGEIDPACTSRDLKKLKEQIQSGEKDV